MGKLGKNGASVKSEILDEVNRRARGQGAEEITDTSMSEGSVNKIASKIANYITQVLAYIGITYYWGFRYAVTAWAIVTLHRVVKNQ